MRKYGIRKSTITDIKRQEKEMKDFAFKKARLGMTTAVKVAKVMKTGNNGALNQALYIWFRQCRENHSSDRPIFREKAVFLEALVFSGGFVIVSAFET